MEFVFDLLAEIIFEPIIEGYLVLMTRFSGNSKKISENMVKTIVILESVVLFLMFVIGGIMSAESSGESLTGKILFVLSIAVSLIQISLGIIFNIIKKRRNK